jgi:hypothetical protein
MYAYRDRRCGMSAAIATRSVLGECTGPAEPLGADAAVADGVPTPDSCSSYA